MSGVADLLIAQGMSASEALAKARLAERCAQVIGTHEPSAFFVPGRIEVLGKHTDYAGGRSLLCAVERGFVVLVSARADATVRVTDVVRGETRELALDPELEVTRGNWSNYPTTVARRVARNFPAARRGADIAFASDLPAASGMSSSSALVIGIFFALAAVNELASDARYRAEITSPEALAAYLAAMENGHSFAGLEGAAGVGTLGGSEDHTAILCCRTDCLSQYTFAPTRAEAVIPFPTTCALVVAYSGVAAEKTGTALSAYNEAALSAHRILSIWNDAMQRADRTLAEASASEPSAPARIRDLLTKSTAPDFTPQRLLDRFDQFRLETMDIIPRAAAAFRDSNLAAFGELVDRSQLAAETLLRNQIPETIALTRLARAGGAAAASAFGAGFGGSVWALVEKAAAQRFVDDWRDVYQREFPAAAARAEFMVTRPGPAALTL